MIDPRDNNDEEEHEEESINWNNLIFLPFNPVFKLIVMCSVLVKSILGPIQSVYPIVYCWDVMDGDPMLAAVKFFYWYCADPIYGIDTFLYIVHRQVTDEALKREHLPKSGLCLFLDFAAMIPFFRLLVVNDCPPKQLWPNILSFNEVLILYRVFEYFELSTTHSVLTMLFGFMLLLFCLLNAITCFWILLTYDGLCRACNNYGELFDWRAPLKYKFNETSESYSTYLYGMAFVFTFITNTHIDDIRPFTIREYIAVNMFTLLGYLLAVCIIIPKLFAETVLSYRRVFSIYPHMQRLVDETKRRNSPEKAYKVVENFYTVMWWKRSGITHVPEAMIELPRYLRIDIRQDLGWALFHHSPTLRKTSMSFKRFLVEKIAQDFKLPGERFFGGPHSHSNLYYIKSGVVQILSEDDGMTPVISVTSGTIFGEANFQIPPLRRKVTIKCLTYCEIMSVSRFNYIKALHKYPADRNEILALTQERLEHAKILYARKKNVQGLARADEEGILWVKRRWWELADFITNWKQKTRKDSRHCDLPPEETDYHCAKYIGQLVLCTEAQLLTKSLFANVDFPWLFVPHSSFIYGWRKVVLVTVILVLLLYPPFITARETPTWFKFFQIFVDLIYALDICISLLTAMMKRVNAPTNFASVMFARCKTLYFNLDCLSTFWIEYLVIIIGDKEHFYIAQANRLLKIYILFTGEFTERDIRNNPLYSVFIRIILCNFCFTYISGYLIYTLRTHFLHDLTYSYFFGKKYCVVVNGVCDPGARGPLGVFISWLVEIVFFSKNAPRNLIDIYVAMCSAFISFMICLYCKAIFISAVYLRHREVSDFQNFVANSRKYYEFYKIHEDLLKRLNKYLMCHWKYYQGADIMHPQLLKYEPYDIYRKVQGEVAERIIGQSQAFIGADPGLVKDLAYAAKFLILPRTSTLFLFGVQSKMVIWIVQGYVKCEYHNEQGELLKVFYPPGKMLSVSSVFLGKASLRTYTACTDCEILYLKNNDFFKIIKQYPNEWSHINRCIAEFTPIFEDMYHGYVKKHTDYLKKLRDRVFHARRSTVAVRKLKTLDALEEKMKPRLPIEHDFWTEPESDFIQYWMLLRAIIVGVSIVNATVQGGSGAEYRRVLTMIGAFCDCIAWIDIVLKMFMAYYDEKGVLVYDKQKCMLHYITRGFLLDVIGSGPWHQVLSEFVSMQLEYNYFMLINTFCKFAHLYILTGYLDYLSDKPTMNVAYITIFKLQLVMILTMFGACHYLMTCCVSMQFDDHANLVSYSFLNKCWVPRIFTRHRTEDAGYYLHLLYAESIFMAQCGLVGVNFGGFVVNSRNLEVGILMLMLTIMFWYVMGYSLTLLVLNSRGNTVFQHGVSQLRKFLTEERVNPKIIDNAIAHFTYWWHRTKGINIQHLTNERIGVVFRQDLNYYFRKKTFMALDTILHGGENIGRQLASVSNQLFILPREEILRELDLISSVYVVHRGKVLILQNGEVLATLTKGSIFGMLSGVSPRPIKVSAQSEEHVDLLLLSIKQFQENITDDIRKIIAETPTSKNNYMATKKHLSENPYDSIAYILRGRKTIFLPGMSKPLEVHYGNWYCRWLYCAWFVEPFATAIIVIALQTLTNQRRILQVLYVIIALDICFFLNLMSEYFTVELEVIDQKCVRRKVGCRMFKKLIFYVDAITLLVPLLTFVNGDVVYQLIRVLRLRLLFIFNAQFCKSFKTKIAPILVKFTIIVLIFHATSCGWMVIACKGEFAFPTPDNLPSFYNATINTDEWVYPETRPDRKGCARLFSIPGSAANETIFLVPKVWYHDYILAMTHIFLIYTHTSIQAFIPVTLGQIYYQICITFMIFIVDIWLMSVAISFMYTRVRELYQYDYGVNNLIIYMKRSGLGPALLRAVTKYTSMLWTRQRGNWLPELAQQAPMCLREDMFCALYEHHLETPPLMRNLPEYFKRQVAARLKRIVIFPGKCIVAEGDTFPCIYFIHEGEVEKWYKDKNGEHRMMSLLITNGYFGQVAGLFPNFPFQFSYYTRTVCDLVTLYLPDWQDLLDGYPDIKRNLYQNLMDIKSNFDVGTKVRKKTVDEAGMGSKNGSLKRPNAYQQG